MIRRTTCRVCDGGLAPVLSLGEQYVSDFPACGADDGEKMPLELARCAACGLLQLRHTAPPEKLYRNYWYRSGTNRTMRAALADIATQAERLVGLKGGDTVLDIGCNDGTLLGSYEAQALYKAGFDPAVNLAELSRRVADAIVVDFFSAAAYFSQPELAGRRPRIITSIAMFYDLDDPRAFVSDIEKVIDPDGVWVIQMAYLPLMLQQNAFDNICHEHLEYYSLQSLEALLGYSGLAVVDMALNDVNGGSFRIYIRPRAAREETFGDRAYRQEAAARLAAVRQQEAAMTLREMTPYGEFATRVDRIAATVVGFIKREVRAGKSVYVYGASTKGNTLLQYFGLDSTWIAGAADRNPEKWGRRTVGTHIPIVSEEQARAAKPDYFLVLPWHFLPEFADREREFLARGGQFIVPLPGPRVIGADALTDQSALAGGGGLR